MLFCNQCGDKDIKVYKINMLDGCTCEKCYYQIMANRGGRAMPKWYNQDEFIRLYNLLNEKAAQKSLLAALRDIKSRYVFRWLASSDTFSGFRWRGEVRYKNKVMKLILDVRYDSAVVEYNILGGAGIKVERSFNGDKCIHSVSR